MAQVLWGGRTGPTGGTGRDLDAITVASITDGDFALVKDDAGIFRYYHFNASGTAAEYDPLVIRPDDYSSQGNWELATAPGPALVIPTGARITGGISGLGLSQAADSDHDITFAVGTCADSTNSVELRLSTAMTKQIDATWAAGTTAGGLFSGASLTPNTPYYMVIIQKDSDGTIDCGFDDNIIGTNNPAGYTKFRPRGIWPVDASSNFIDATFSNETLTFKKASEVAINSTTNPPAGINTAVALTAFITETNFTPEVMIGARAVTTNQSLGLSNDGVNVSQHIYGGYLTSGDTEIYSWGADYTKYDFISLLSTSIYWGDAGVTNLGGTATLHLHKIKVNA